MILGIDPGFSGGLAVINHKGEWIDGMRMPIYHLQKREMIDTRELTKFWASALGASGSNTIVIESVHSMPKQGVASTFKFGRAAGSVEAWALTMPCEMAFVTPQKWKKDMGVKREKRSSLKLANDLFPEAGAVDWSVLRNDGIAEAALMAYHHWHFQHSLV